MGVLSEVTKRASEGKEEETNTRSSRHCQCSDLQKLCEKFLRKSVYAFHRRIRLHHPQNGMLTIW